MIWANFEILDEDKSRNGNSEFVFLSPQITFFDGDLFASINRLPII